VRRETSPGVFELVNPTHSWNAPQRVSNYLLLKLQRHSDHHAWPNRRFQVLRSFPESPQLPASYGAMLALVLCPPLFFRVMNPMVERIRAEAAKIELIDHEN
jgi:alkane 1-monooxygenase